MPIYFVPQSLFLSLGGLLQSFNIKLIKSRILHFWLVASLIILSACANNPPLPIPTSDIELPLQIPKHPTPYHAPKNFTQAKKSARLIFASHSYSFYCGCKYQEGTILENSCSYKPDRVNARTYRIEWEHIVPAKMLGETLTCWHQKICKDSAGISYKGRACCAKTSKQFKQMEADLHNLVPAIGLVNQARGTLPFGELKKAVKPFMGCDLKISKTEQMVEPRKEIRGIIARAYLYMNRQYNVFIPPKEKLKYREWHQLYPPDKWEIE